MIKNIHRHSEEKRRKRRVAVFDLEGVDARYRCE